MIRVAAVFVLLGTLGAAGFLFYFGLVAGTAEKSGGYWLLRVPVWGLALLFVALGIGAVWLAFRSDRRS